jgi:hypothetical protein
MYYEKDIRQHEDIVILPMIIPGIDDQTSTETWEGTVNPGTASILTREGEASGLDNLAVPEPKEPDNEFESEATTRTSSGHTIKPPDHLIEVFAAAGATVMAGYEIMLTAAEISYYATMKEMGEHLGEIACGGAGLGGKFLKMQELHMMKYKQAMKTKVKENWELLKKNMAECLSTRFGKECLARPFPKETRSLLQTRP